MYNKLPRRLFFVFGIFVGQEGDTNKMTMPQGSIKALGGAFLKQMFSTSMAGGWSYFLGG